MQVMVRGIAKTALIFHLQDKPDAITIFKTEV